MRIRIQIPNVFTKCGEFIGRISNFFLPRSFVWYPCYLFRRGFATGRAKKIFREFGFQSKLAKDLTLIHPEKISIGNNSSIMTHSILETTGKTCRDGIYIGDNVSIGEYSHITSHNKVVIGNGVLTGRFVLISDNSHGRSIYDELVIEPLKRPIISNGCVIIKDNVWIGDKVSILSGVTIGEGCIIGANSVVTHDIPDYSLAGGIPAKIIKRIPKE